MKIPRPNVSRRRRQRGSAVLILLILLLIMVMLAAANSSALLHFHRELKLLDQRQVERLNASQTNATPAVIAPVHPDSK
jgi:hypothetical protein